MQHKIIKQNFRGYVFSREIGPHRVPQHIQNLVIRNYANQTQINYLLSSVEYRMDECFYMLNKTIDELVKIDGIILYSMFMLPKSKEKRLQIYEQVFSKNGQLLASVEDLSLKTPQDASKWEEIFEVNQICDFINYKDIRKWLL